MTTAFVSGATGFIAQHLIVLLLSKNYKVVGSVRSEQKGEHLKTLINNPRFGYVVVSDLVKPGAFDEALKSNPDVEVFFHAASPVLFAESDFQEQIISPAVEGTKNALKAVHAYGKNVKKFVLTSSNAAVSGSRRGTPDDGIKWTEDTWSEFTQEQAVANGRNAYSASKTFGELAAWKFLEEEKPQFTLTTVNPSFVFGPQAFSSEVKDTLNLSAEVINAYLKLKAGDPLPVFTGAFYDVRDVAKAHLVAYEDDATIGKRLVLVTGIFTPSLIAKFLRDTYPQLRKTIPEVDESAIPDQLKREDRYDLRKTNKLLGFEPIGFEQSVKDSVDQIFQFTK